MFKEKYINLNPNQKQCTHCGEWYELTFFTKDNNRKDKKNLWCKNCTRGGNRNRYFLTRDDRLKQIAEYRKSERGKEVMNRSIKKWVKKNPKKYLAHIAINHAIKLGVVTPVPCEICGNTVVTGHHPNYDLVFDVRWLCYQHHADVHKELRDSVNSLLPKEK